ncbi:DUF4349 domain-containing protein [Aquibacillus koreensis]|uniref:DUF4349 domain-containing protein n=1 Tax=Aquibacillus koreensis TaxID=279446 RepID=A0A9X3WQ35_9BACI|nr:DUF4349 domain-containing protein [Aquibacillus koreensis]MCT2534895.1 DUF4349 domain-containing protein [Aquibacillus koreensis]MDC3422211.1 DUF4349 domain-containing protein [Aquibacillus koreensis]
MKKRVLYIMFILLGVILVACSNDQNSLEESANEDAGMDTEESADMEMKMSDDGEYENQAESPQEDVVADEATNGSTPQVNRMIIYNANLTVEVKNYTNAMNELQKQVTDQGGYIVESNTYGGSEEDLSEGMIKVRIPQEKFQSFIQLIEQGSVKVVEKNVSGEDVTEQYVDLESRLKSKRVVEERLLSFMEQAEKTEDLLKISSDLAKVQEEIEQLTGKMNYLKNQSDLATVTIHMYENRVNIPSVNQEELNTWDKTKEQFMNSINFLLAAFSGLVVFFVGNLPSLILLGILGIIVYRIVRKRMKDEPKGNS